MTDKKEKLNDDGLVAGQAVDFATMRRITQGRKLNAESGGGDVHTDEPKVQNIPTAASKKKAK